MHNILCFVFNDSKSAVGQQLGISVAQRATVDIAAAMSHATPSANRRLAVGIAYAMPSSCLRQQLGVGHFMPRPPNSAHIVVPWRLSGQQFPKNQIPVLYRRLLAEVPGQTSSKAANSVQQNQHMHSVQSV